MMFAAATTDATPVRPMISASAPLPSPSPYINDLAARFQSEWRPDCSEPAADITISVAFRVGPTGQLIGAPTSSAPDSPDPLVRAASDRAIRAVYAAGPFTNMPPSLVGQRIVVNFSNRIACRTAG